MSDTTTPQLHHVPTQVATSAGESMGLRDRQQATAEHLVQVGK